MASFGGIDSGTSNTTSSDAGVTVDLIGGPTFVAGVIAGKYFRVTSGPLAGKQAKITNRVSGTQLTLDGGIDANFTLESWVVSASLRTQADHKPVTLQASKRLSNNSPPGSYSATLTARNFDQFASVSYPSSRPLTLAIANPTTRTVFQRAIDLGGTGSYVYWITPTPNQSPLSTDTIPNFTGTLTHYEIVLDETSC